MDLEPAETAIQEGSPLATDDAPQNGHGEVVATPLRDPGGQLVGAYRESKEGILEVSRAIDERAKSGERIAASADDAASGIDGIREALDAIEESTGEQRAAVAELREIADGHAVAESGQTRVKRPVTGGPIGNDRGSVNPCRREYNAHGRQVCHPSQVGLDW